MLVWWSTVGFNALFTLEKTEYPLCLFGELWLPLVPPSVDISGGDWSPPYTLHSLKWPPF